MSGPNLVVRGYVEWEKRDVRTGKLTGAGISNRIMPYGLGQALRMILGITNSPGKAPNYIRLATTTGLIVGTETTVTPTDSEIILIGAGNDRGKDIAGQEITAALSGRYRFQFSNTDFTGTIRRAGLYNDGDENAAGSPGADGRLWALAEMNLTKGPSETLTIYWTINIETAAGASGNPILQFANQASITNLELTAGQLITPVQLPQAGLVNSAEDISYEIYPDLPTGLILTGNVLSGTPAASQEASNYTYSAVAAELRVGLNFSITVT